MESDPTQRFSSRVEDYIRFRPSYPEEILARLARECGLSAEARIAELYRHLGACVNLECRQDCRHATQECVRHECLA